HTSPLSLHDALPIYCPVAQLVVVPFVPTRSGRRRSAVLIVRQSPGHRPAVAAPIRHCFGTAPTARAEHGQYAAHVTRYACANYRSEEHTSELQSREK